jgi:hypothetical protein
MITVANYQTEINKLDWSKLPASIKSEKDAIDSIIEFYNDDNDIKETIDLFIELVNKNLPKVEKPKAEKIVVTTSSKKAQVINASLRKIMSDTKYLKDVMPDLQQKALLEMENSEEREFFVEKILELDDVLASSIKPQNKDLMNSIVKAHFFYGQSDWFILDYDPKQKMFFGYVVLNGDTEMSEPGYISVKELLSVKRVEMDFYWNEKTLMKALNSKYPSEFPIEKETEKTSPKNSPSKPSKPKVEKVIVDKTIVDNFSPEFLLIRRFWNIIKSESVSVPFRTVQLLYMAFNKAAVERKVRKVSKDAELFTACNKKIVTLFEDIPNDAKKPYKIEFTDKKLYNQIKEYVSDVAVNPAIPLLKRFIGMQNTKPEIKKAETLLKSINKIFEQDKGNRLFDEIKLAKISLSDYVSGRDKKVDLMVYGLSRPRTVCTNRIKCEGVDKSGKLHKGYKFERGTGNIIRVKRKVVKKKR